MFALLDIEPSGVFLTRPHLVGATEAEIDARSRDELPKERLDVIAFEMKMAAVTLSRRMPEGHC